MWICNIRAYLYCREFLTTETHLNISEMETIGNETNLNISNMETFGNETFRGDSHGLLAIGYIIAIAVVLTVIILIWMIFQKRKKGNNNRYILHNHIAFLTAITVLRVGIYHNY